MAKKKERKVSTAAKGVTEGAENGGDDEDRTIITTNIGGGGGGSGGDPMNGTTVNGGDEDDDNDSGDLWDLVRVLSSPPTPSESESVANATCRMDGCNNKAIVVWAQQRHPEDEWPMCETCQESEFGGWPNVVEGRPTVTADEPATEQETKVSHTEQHMDATDSAKTELGKDDRHDEPEVWDLKTILSVQDITEKASKCSTDTCNLHAACIWVSNQAPSEDWFTCLDCQVSECCTREEVSVHRANRCRMCTGNRLWRLSAGKDGICDRSRALQCHVQALFAPEQIDVPSYGWHQDTGQVGHGLRYDHASGSQRR